MILSESGVNIALRLYSVTTQSMSKSEKHLSIERIYPRRASFHNKLIFYYQIQTQPTLANVNAVLHLSKNPAKLNQVYISSVLLLRSVLLLYQGQAAAQGIVPMWDIYIKRFYNFCFVQNAIKRACGGSWVF